MEVLRLLDLPESPITSESLDKDLLHPIESNGYAELREAAAKPSAIRQRPSFHWLAKWILLHFQENAEGKEAAGSEGETRI